MRRRSSYTLTRFSACVLLSLCALAGQAAAQDPPVYVSDEFIVVLTPEASGSINVAAGPTVNIASLQNVIAAQDVTAFLPQFPAGQSAPAGDPCDLSGYYKAKIGPNGNRDTAIAAFAADASVDHVEKISVLRLDGNCATTGTPLTPNDEFRPNQDNFWGDGGIDADRAWRIETGHEGVVVVAMDSGCRYAHQDLGGTNPPGPDDNDTNGNIWVNPFEIPGNGIDDEGNGYIDDVVGWDFVDGATPCATGEDCSAADYDPNDFHGHGTHVAGIMAAITNNGVGVSGVAGGFAESRLWDGSKVMCLRIGWKRPPPDNLGQVTMDYAAQAIRYVADMKDRGVNIVAVNASWESSDDGGIDAAVDCLLSRDVMLIHAAGNRDRDFADYLGNKAGVMNVAASSGAGRWQQTAGIFGSNYGDWVDIAAPGNDIFSTDYDAGGSGNTYGWRTGTSMAAPHVTGVAALLESVDPSLSGPSKFDLMKNNGCEAWHSDQPIGEILNAQKALDALLGTGNIPPLPQFPTGNAVEIETGQKLDVSVQFTSPEPNQTVSVTIADLDGALLAGLKIDNDSPPSEIVTIHLLWEVPTCADVRPDPYRLQFTATDNFNPPGQRVVSLEINVVGAATPSVYVAWDEPPPTPPPSSPQDYRIIPNASNPDDVELRAGSEKWRVWSEFCDNTPSFAGDIGVISAVTAQDFGVRIENDTGGPGANNVQDIHLGLPDLANYSRITGGTILGDVQQGLYLQRSSGGVGGDVIGDLRILGTVSNSITIAEVASGATLEIEELATDARLTIENSSLGSIVVGNMQEWAFVQGTDIRALTVTGVVEEHAGITLYQPPDDAELHVGTLDGWVYVGGHYQGTMAFGSVPSADATIDIAGNLTGPLTVNGQFNGNLCADNLFGGSEPLPPNIHLGPPIGLSAQICGATASACAAVAAAASDESPVKPKSRYISFVPGSCQSGDPPEPCAYAIRIGMTKLHHVGHCSQTLSTTCNIDAQCPAGEVCVIARCSITGAPCTYTSDCGQSGGACVGYPSGRCTLPESQPACIVDEDCSGGTCVRTPPPDLSAHQGQWRYVNQVPDTLSRCCNPNSNPLSCNTAVSCDSNANCAGLGLNTHCVKQLCPDSTAFGTFFPCAKTGCTPEYRDWAGETGGRALHVTGSEIVPSSVYHLHAIGQACAEPAPNWANYSSALAVATNEWSNTDNQGNVASAADLGWVVDKVKDKVGAAIKPVAHLRTIELNPLSAVNASDIGRANDAVKGRGYPFEICDCVPDIICGRERCFDDDGNKRCVGSQTCVDGYCRDACMRCTQPQP